MHKLYSQSHPMTPPIRLMTFNIAHGRGLGFYQGFMSRNRLERNLLKIAKLMVDMQVDIAALQEVDEHSHWTKKINFIEVLQEKGGFAYAALGIHNKREHAQKPLAYGNVILSRFPIQASEHHPFGEATLGEKGFLYAQMQIYDQLLDLINVHLDYRSRKRRLLQIQQLIHFLSQKKWTTPPIICGDFNALARKKADAVEHLTHYIGMNHTYTICPYNTGTFPAHMPIKKLSRAVDFFLIPTCYRLSDCQVMLRYLSDHRPVLAQIQKEGL